MQHAGREKAVLAAHAGMRISRTKRSESSRPQPLKAASKPSTAIEIAAPDRQIAGARAAPAREPQLAQRSERQRISGASAVDAAARALRDPVAIAPVFRLEPVAQDALGQSRDSRMRLPVTNQPGSQAGGGSATKSGRAMQSPSRKMQ